VISRNLYICTQQEHQHSLTAVTIMESCKKPVTYWFKTIWWFTPRKSGINAVSLKELSSFGSYDTAWYWLQKHRHCTIRQGCEKFTGRVEIDEFSVGSQKSGEESAVLMVKQLSL
jgi:hypothetical protein